MSMKVVAIGNRLMGDDGLAVQVAENIYGNLEELGIEVIIGETDVDYCLSKIKEGDYLIILDATWFGREPGTITLNKLNDIYEKKSKQGMYSLHGFSLVRMLKSCYQDLDGILIGIEGCNFNFSMTLSRELEKKLDSIYKGVKEIIYMYLKNLCSSHDY